MFPGEIVDINAPCLLGDDSLHLKMKDGELVLVDPETIVGYTRSRLGMEEPDQPFR